MNPKSNNKTSIEEDDCSSATIEGSTEDIVSSPNNTEKPTLSFNELIEQIHNQIDEKVANIPYDFNDMDQKQDWFIAYKEIIAAYPKEFQPTTIYDDFSIKELELLFRIVQAEAGDEWDFDEKANVASVIFNRLNSGKYNSLTHVLTAPKQFSPYASGKYLKVTIDEKTVLACEYVFMFGDTTNGCYGFKMTKEKKWNGWEWQFNDDTHHFYK